MSLITPYQNILFKGDSITDAGRNRSNPDDLGVGYAALAAAWFVLRPLLRRVSAAVTEPMTARPTSGNTEVRSGTISVLSASISPP